MRRVTAILRMFSRIMARAIHARVESWLVDAGHAMEATLHIVGMPYPSHPLSCVKT